MNLKSKLLAGIASLALFATTASAEITVPDSLDVSKVEEMAGVMLIALGLIWVARRVVSFLR